MSWITGSAILLLGSGTNLEHDDFHQGLVWFEAPRQPPEKQSSGTDVVPELWPCYFLSPGSAPSTGAPVPDEPMNSFWPFWSVRSRPLARFDPSLA